uniref:lysozyme n=1 Tax=Leptobrachium leishanense TaxID=445787 RepID=A0A8C5QWX2_9ANUR
MGIIMKLITALLLTSVVLGEHGTEKSVTDSYVQLATDPRINATKEPITGSDTQKSSEDPTLYTQRDARTESYQLILNDEMSGREEGDQSTYPPHLSSRITDTYDGLQNNPNNHGAVGGAPESNIKVTLNPDGNGTVGTCLNIPRDRKIVDEPQTDSNTDGPLDSKEDQTKGHLDLKTFGVTDSVIGTHNTFQGNYPNHGLHQTATESPNLFISNPNRYESTRRIMAESSIFPPDFKGDGVIDGVTRSDKEFQSNPSNYLAGEPVTGTSNAFTRESTDYQLTKGVPTGQSELPPDVYSHGLTETYHVSQRDPNTHQSEESNIKSYGAVTHDPMNYRTTERIMEAYTQVSRENRSTSGGRAREIEYVQRPATSNKPIYHENSNLTRRVMVGQTKTPPDRNGYETTKAYNKPERERFGCFDSATSSYIKGTHSPNNNKMTGKFEELRKEPSYESAVTVIEPLNTSPVHSESSGRIRTESNSKLTSNFNRYSRLKESDVTNRVFISTGGGHKSSVNITDDQVKNRNGQNEYMPVTKQRDHGLTNAGNDRYVSQRDLDTGPEERVTKTYVWPTTLPEHLKTFHTLASKRDQLTKGSPEQGDYQTSTVGYHPPSKHSSDAKISQTCNEEHGKEEDKGAPLETHPMTDNATPAQTMKDVSETCKLMHSLKSHGLDVYYGYSVVQWICLIKHTSGFNTRLIKKNAKNKSADFGIFQINNKLWCKDTKTRGSKNKCKISCSKLLDNDLNDDIRCAKKIVKEAKGLSAWSAWKKHCKGKNLSQYNEEC